ncbi:hypothetical protein B7486_55190, partial [cyanobacterium TDX16]
IAAFAMLVVWRAVPEERVDSADKRMDYRGVGVLSLGVVCVLVALDEGPSDGFGQPWILGLLAVGLVALASFLFVERSVGDRALVPRDVLQNRLFARSCIVVLLMSAIFFSALVFLPQLMQKDLGFSALESGAGLLPMMLVFAVTSFVAGGLYDRLGARTVVSAGALFLGLGMVLLAGLMDDEGFWSLVPGMVVLGLGVGLFYSSITTTAVTALDAARSSLAGGIVYMCQIAGGAVGLGVNTAIVVSAEQLSDGIRNAFVLDAVLAAVGLVIVLRTLPRTGAAEHRPHLRHHHRAHAS